MKKIYFFLGLMLAFQAVSNAQSQSSWTDKENKGPQVKVVIKGKVLDSESGDPLEFATISLFNQATNQVITGSITDAEGQFTLDARPGNFYAKVEFISYQSKVIENIQVSAKPLQHDLGVIQLSMDAATLSEVEVRAEKSQMQMSLDKRVFNVGKDLANRGGTAADILDNVPSVTVDIEGNIELRGSGNVRILVDGKPSGLLSVDDASSLRQLPADLIDRIEVITNPSARYEAEGLAGIINIILRKDKRAGLNGSFDLTAGYPEQFGAAVNLNYRKNNFNFFTNYGITYRGAPGGGSRFQEFFLEGDTSNISEQERDINRGGWSNNIRFGADYYFNERNILTTSFLYKIADESNFTTLSFNDFIKTGGSDRVPTSITERIDEEQEDETNLEYALNYKRTFEQKGREFNVVLSYLDKSEEEGSDFTNTILNPDRSPSGLPQLQQRSRNDEGEDLLRLQIDYIHPFGKDHKFEVGGLSSIRNINNNYLVEEWNEDKWEKLIDFSNQFRYDEDIYAGYAIYSNKTNKLSYQVGLRAEFSDVRTELIENDSINARTYINPFPSAFISYELPNQNSIQISYSRRIKRPRFWDLNPFFTFSDDRNFFGGNPNLDPEFTDSYELGHIKYFKAGSLGSSFYYRRTTDVIQRIRRFSSDGTTFTRPENLASRDDWGLEFNFSYNPKKWLRFNGNFNFFRSITEGEEFGRADNYTWTSRINNRTTLWKGIDLQITFNYRAPRDTPQGSRQAVWSMNLGMSKDILNKKGTLTFSARDLFNSRRWMWTIDQADFFEIGDFQWRARQFTLSFNYRLNQKKKRGGNRRGGGGYDGGGGQF
ncbi:MAG: outer membrane beta-barrel family protein [Bacteroidota bacterium]